MSAIVRNTIFFIGWILSPLTFWNDAFVNIPIAYLFANLFLRIFRADFLIMVVVFYWISNVAGLLMMYISGRYVIRSGKIIIKDLTLLIATMVIYTAILIILGKIGLIRPI